jgi:hypothetical protein
MKMKMKQNILFLVLGIMLVFSACEPMEKRNDLGPVYTEAELLNYMSVTVNGNTVTCENKAPGVISYWTTDFGTQSNESKVDFTIPLKSSYTATLTAFCAGGPVTVSKKFEIATSDPNYYNSPYWNLLTNGMAGKTWVWASDIPGGKVWGNGGHMGNVSPGWWTLGTGDLAGQGGSPDDELTFNLDKAHNVIVTMPQVAGSLVAPKPGTGAGKFNMDFTKTLIVSDTLYSKGQITFTNWTVPLGMEPNSAGKPLHYVFNILKLTEDELVLEFPEPGVTSAWGTAWFYMFKRKGYSYPK